MFCAFVHGLVNPAAFAQKLLPRLTGIPGASSYTGRVVYNVTGAMLAGNLRHIIEVILQCRDNVRDSGR